MGNCCAKCSKSDVLEGAYGNAQHDRTAAQHLLGHTSRGKPNSRHATEVDQRGQMNSEPGNTDYSIEDVKATMEEFVPQAVVANPVLFAGHVVYFCGDSSGTPANSTHDLMTRDQLKDLFMRSGGRIACNLGADVTHICVTQSARTDSRCRTAVYQHQLMRINQYGAHPSPVVLDAWIIASIMQNQVCNTGFYLSTFVPPLTLPSRLPTSPSLCYQNGTPSTPQTDSTINPIIGSRTPSKPTPIVPAAPPSPAVRPKPPENSRTPGPRPDTVAPAPSVKTPQAAFLAGWTLILAGKFRETDLTGCRHWVEPPVQSQLKQAIKSLGGTVAAKVPVSGGMEVGRRTVVVGARQAIEGSWQIKVQEAVHVGLAVVPLVWLDELVCRSGEGGGANCDVGSLVERHRYQLGSLDGEKVTSALPTPSHATTGSTPQEAVKAEPSTTAQPASRGEPVGHHKKTGTGKMEVGDHTAAVSALSGHESGVSPQLHPAVHGSETLPAPTNTTNKVPVAHEADPTAAAKPPAALLAGWTLILAGKFRESDLTGCRHWVDPPVQSQLKQAIKSLGGTVAAKVPVSGGMEVGSRTVVVGARQAIEGSWQIKVQEAVHVGLAVVPLVWLDELVCRPGEGGGASCDVGSLVERHRYQLGSLDGSSDEESEATAADKAATPGTSVSTPGVKGAKAETSAKGEPVGGGGGEGGRNYKVPQNKGFVSPEPVWKEIKVHHSPAKSLEHVRRHLLHEAGLYSSNADLQNVHSAAIQSTPDRNAKEARNTSTPARLHPAVRPAAEPYRLPSPLPAAGTMAPIVVMSWNLQKMKCFTDDSAILHWMTHPESDMYAFWKGLGDLVDVLTLQEVPMSAGPERIERMCSTLSQISGEAFGFVVSTAPSAASTAATPRERHAFLYRLRTARPRILRDGDQSGERANGQAFQTGITWFATGEHDHAALQSAGRIPMHYPPLTAQFDVCHDWTALAPRNVVVTSIHLPPLAGGEGSRSEQRRWSSEYRALLKSYPDHMHAYGIPTRQDQLGRADFHRMHRIPLHVIAGDFNTHPGTGETEALLQKYGWECTGLSSDPTSSAGNAFDFMLIHEDSWQRVNHGPGSGDKRHSADLGLWSRLQVRRDVVRWHSGLAAAAQRAMTEAERLVWCEGEVVTDDHKGDAEVDGFKLSDHYPVCSSFLPMDAEESKVKAQGGGVRGAARALPFTAEAKPPK